MFHCDAYNDLRYILNTKACSLLPTFNNLTENDKIKFSFTHPSQISLSAETCFKILQRRNSLLYN